MHVGIDLGTTYCCVAYIDDGGQTRVIPNAEGQRTTPSIICFDGKQAWVGQKAKLRKETRPHQIHEFIKRDMGAPVEIPPNLYDEENAPEAKPYAVGNFKYGAAGMSAIILRKLKKDALRHFKQEEMLTDSVDEKNFDLDAVITVPAYFGDVERQQTKLAGFAAGLNVIGIVNEPTAAAFAYGMGREGGAKIMVFDLGGGTFDVTILEMRSDGKAEVLASAGNRELGGKDFDELIQDYLYDAFYNQRGTFVPTDDAYNVQQAATRTKLELSDAEEATAFFDTAEGDFETTLYRSAPEGWDEFSMNDDDGAFYFEERATSLLNRCRALCESALEDVEYETRRGTVRHMEWGDLDEVIMAGGSCRMPMIPNMLEDLTGQLVRSHIEGFDYDVAIAKGAALYGEHPGHALDVAAHSIGIKLQNPNDGRFYIEHLIHKNERLPARAEETYHAGSNAELEVYQGEAKRPDEYDVPRGRLELDNPEGEVTVVLRAEADGTLTAKAEYPPHGEKKVELASELYIYDERAAPLREKVQSIRIRS